MSPEFTSLFSQHAGASHAKQIAFADFVGAKRNWGVDLAAGRVTLGNDLSYPIQLLGTEASGDASWLWAWANEQSNLPPQLLQVCNQLRAIGVERHIPEFTNRSFSLNVVTGHMISAIAAGLNHRSCYFRGPYEGGALFFLVSDIPEAVLGPFTLSRVTTVLAESICEYEVNHREMAESFLRAQDFTLHPGAGSLLHATRQSDSIQIAFDSLGRIANVESKIVAVKPSTPKWWQFWRKD